MTAAPERRLVNLLGAAATAINDAIIDATTRASDLDEVATTALVVMLDFSQTGTVKRLSEALGITHSGTVRLVDRLERAGHVRRRPGDDARSLSVVLSDSGASIAQAVRDARHTAIAEVLATVNRDDREQLVDTLDVIVGRLTAQRLDVRRSGRKPAGGALCRLCDFAACERPRGKCPAQKQSSTSR